MIKTKKIKGLAAAAFFLFCLSALSLSSAAEGTPKKYKAIPLSDHMKGAWIASVENIDFPSEKGLSPREQKKEYRKLLDSLKEAGIDTVFVQVRPAADTFWPSKTEPWSVYLTGVQGKKPGLFYNPLKFMIKETHKRGMAFHAWLNPYRVTNSTDAVLTDDHFAKRHPETVVEYGGKLYYNPANELSRLHTEELIGELASEYDIDGIHFDDYFYPYPVKENGQEVNFPDSADFAKTGNGMSLEDWRRNNVNTLVREVHETVKRVSPDIAFGISPFGVWRNKSEETPDGSETKAFECYDKLYADSRAWIKNGWVDYIMPQIYWNFDHPTAPYGVLLDWWDGEVKNYGNGKVKLYIGLGLYKYSAGNNPWKEEDFEKQLRAIEERPGISGGVFFSAKYIRDNEKNEREIIRNFYPENRK